MKKIVLLLCAAMMVFLIAGCTKDGDEFVGTYKLIQTKQTEHPDEIHSFIVISRENDKVFKMEDYFLEKHKAIGILDKDRITNSKTVKAAEMVNKQLKNNNGTWYINKDGNLVKDKFIYERISDKPLDYTDFKVEGFPEPTER